MVPMLTWGLVLSYLPLAARTVSNFRVNVLGLVVVLRKKVFEGFEMKEEVRFSLKLTGAGAGVWGVVYWKEDAAVAAAEIEAMANR